MRHSRYQNGFNHKRTNPKHGWEANLPNKHTRNPPKLRHPNRKGAKR